MEVLCGFTDTKHEVRKPKLMWTDDELEARADDGHGDEKSHCNDACDPRTDELEVCVLKMKDLRELEAQHESGSATDDQKFRMHSEFKAICLTDETRLWSMEHSDQRAEHLREMHVRDSESDRIARQCSR